MEIMNETNVKETLTENTEKKTKKRGWWFWTKISLCALLVVYLLIPQQIQNPVEGAGKNSYNHKTFWMPWGDHHHQGIDIFAKRGTPVHSPIGIGIVIGVTHGMGLGGNTVSILGTHGRVYYCAHLEEVMTHIGAIVTSSSVIGTVGDSGNAKGKPCHLHMSIYTLFPRWEHWVPSEERTKKDDFFKIFFVNPVEALDGKQLW